MNTALRLFGGFLVGSAIAAGIFLHLQKVRTLEANVNQLTETVLYMGAHVIAQDLVIEDMNKKLDKVYGARVAY